MYFQDIIIIDIHSNIKWFVSFSYAEPTDLANYIAHVHVWYLHVYISYITQGPICALAFSYNGQFLASAGI